MKKVLFTLSIIVSVAVSKKCTIPLSLAPNLQPLNASRVQNNTDIIRNRKSIKSLCMFSIYFKEHSIPWNMVLIFNKNHPKGPFWFIPHDDENSAFDSAIYATIKYGGGFLAIETGEKRNNKNIDPNRNFSKGKIQGRCKSSPIYTNVIFKIIEYFKPKYIPYLALHSNANGFRGDGRGGGGTVSILRSSSYIKAYKAYKNIVKKKRGGLKDEDSLVYIAGRTSKPPKTKLNKLLESGLNVRYEIVSPNRNDCSMSNFVVLMKNSANYYNVEVEHGDTKTQKEMIDRLMKIIKK